MLKVKTTELGDILVAREAVETIAGMATIDCYGLVGMTPQDIQSGITSLLGIESIRKGVNAAVTENGIVIDVYIVVGYGVKIKEVAHSVMQKVAYVMETIACLPCAGVNVNVTGVKAIR